jgi:hypothetical protein
MTTLAYILHHIFILHATTLTGFFYDFLVGYKKGFGPLDPVKEAFKLM